MFTYYTGVLVGRRTHHRVTTKELRSGVTVRRGKYVALRGHCVECLSVSKKLGKGYLKMKDDTCVPYVTYACDVCRVHLCQSCFFDVYDHGKGGKPSTSVTLR